MGPLKKAFQRAQNGLNIDPIITHRFPVDNFIEGFEAMRSGKSGKVILDWTEEVTSYPHLLSILF